MKTAAVTVAAVTVVAGTVAAGTLGQVEHGTVATLVALGSWEYDQVEICVPVGVVIGKAGYGVGGETADWAVELLEDLHV